MKRNGLALLLVLVVFMSMLSVPANAQEPQSECTHENMSWISMDDYDKHHYPTCTDCFKTFYELKEKCTIVGYRCIICHNTPCTHEDTEKKWVWGISNQHNEVCLYCSEILVSGEHTISDGKCTLCGYHTNCIHESKEWFFDQIGHMLYCSSCPGYEGEYTTHSMTGGKCTICGYASCPDGEHSFYTGYVRSHECIKCGFAIDPKDKNNDGYCDCCGYSGCCHKNAKWICDPDFDPNYHYQECTDCGDMLYEGWSEHPPVNGVCTVCGYECETVTLGDPNGDGKINAKDATLILQYSVGVLKNTQNFDAAAADVSGDGKLNAKDATLILQFSVGLRDSFPAD